MLKNLLKEIITSIAGKQAEPLVELLDGKKYVNEFIIAKKLGFTINQTRNILYKISDLGLVSFIRKKDKRKGWYTYFWKLEIIKCLEFLRADILKKIEQVNYQIKSRETKEFYVCETCNIEFNEENALAHNFICNECGNVLSRKDNAPIIKSYNQDLLKLKRELAYVEEEWKLEKEKLDKIKLREVKKEEELKKKLSKEKSEARKKAKLAQIKKEKSKKQSKHKKKIKPTEKIIKRLIKKPVKNKKKK